MDTSLRGQWSLQAHLKADQYYSVVANMRGTSAEDVATKIISCEALRGLQVTSAPQLSPLPKPSEGGPIFAPHGSASPVILTLRHACDLHHH